jgi:hypothetical protein
VIGLKCCDEKSAIDSLDRLDLVAPLSPSERYEFDYRHGNVVAYAAFTLYVVLNVKTAIVAHSVVGVANDAVGRGLRGGT